MVGAMTATDDALRSFETLKPRLAAVTSPTRPNADPHSAAVTALLVTDFFSHGEMKEKLAASKKVPENAVEELRALARAILHCLTQLGGDWFPQEGKAPMLGALKAVGATERDKLVDKIEANVTAADVRAIVDTIKKGEGDVDLVLDLRALASLLEKHAPNTAELEKIVVNARKVADSVETKLAENDTPAHKEWREHVVRAWTLFAPAYEALCSAARDLSGGDDASKFPPLFTVSRARRTRMRADVAGPGPQSRRGGGPESRRAPESKKAPASKRSAGPEIKEAPGDPAELPPMSAGAISRRTSPRHSVEMEVGISSESNFYVGFTENLSATGVFVATYTPKPIGTKVQITLTFPNGTQIVAPGTVRWIRGSIAGADAWPGMGVQFDKLTGEQDEAVKKFIRFRDPLFFDDE
jgi:uncharacterized protein (TIGR02266 family)